MIGLINELEKMNNRDRMLANLGFFIMLLGVYVSPPGSVLGVAAALITSFTSVLYVVLAKNGSRYRLVFGIITVTIYGMLSYANGIYGDFVQNIFYQLPVLAYGLYREVEHIEKKRDSKTLVVMWIIMFAGILYTLRLTNDPAPVLDAFTTATSMTAIVMLADNNRHQWKLWMASNLVGVVIWMQRDVPYLALMFAFYLINSIIAFVETERSDV